MGTRFLAVCAATILIAGCAQQSSKPSMPLNDGLMGWATLHPNGAPTGGKGPDAESCTVGTIEEFNACINDMHDKPLKDKPFTLYVQGYIDGATQADGWGYTKAVIKRSNLSIIGLNKGTETPTLHAIWIIAKGDENLVLRNLRIIPGKDHELKEPEEGCHSTDTDYCDWNPEPDALTVQNTQRVWIDHCEFTDGPDYKGKNPNKGDYKGYDGLLDIKRGANYVTISYSKFSNHDKSILIGHSDKHDTDNFHVTFYRNHFSYLGQRAPRVRYGKVHLLNNLYTNEKKNDYSEKYHLTYAIGMAFKSDIYSEKNVFDIKGVDARKIMDISDFSKWGQHFTDEGSWLNDKKVDLVTAAKENVAEREALLNMGLSFEGPATWEPTEEYQYPVLNSPESVRKTVKANAGVGIINLDSM